MESEVKTVTVDVADAFAIKTDTGELCRLCANTDNQLMPIFRGEGLEHSIATKIEKYLPIINVTELDKLPLQICYQCASTLIAWNNLYEGCRVADKRLREILCIDDKLYPEDETFEDYVDDYRDNYDEQTHNIPTPTPSTSNLESNILRPDATDITQLNDAKTFNETELDSTDERCLRRTKGGDDGHRRDDRAQTQARREQDPSQRRRDANIPERPSHRATFTCAEKDAITTSSLWYEDDDDDETPNAASQLPAGVCRCVWSRGRCDKCVVFDRFKCYYCPMVFLKVDSRNRHLRGSHREELLIYSVEFFREVGSRMETEGDRTDVESRYECDKCASRFGDKVELIEHLREHVDAPKVVGTTGDGRGTRMSLRSSSGIRRVKRKSSDFAYTPIKRRKSGATSNTDKALVSRKVTYQCEHCDVTVSTKAQMRKHLSTTHILKDNQASAATSIDAAKKQAAKEEAKLIKELAEKSFIASLEMCDTTSALQGADEVQGKEGELKLSTAGYYICAVCGQIFLKRHSFTRHVNLHSSSRYGCDKCKKTFSSSGALTTHQTLKHKELPKNVFFLNGRKYLKCEQCSFTCRNERNKLEEHMRVHTGEKPFTCELCGKQFRTRALLRVHTRYVHEGVKEHACDLCGRCFSNKRYMEEHRRIHTGEKPLICDLCGKTFRQNSSLSKHVENHLGIKKHGCHLCGKRFSNSHHLSIHIKRHMGEANFVCNQCGKGFVDQYQLKNHKVVHSEERPFICVLCGTGFKLLKHLKQHGKTHRTS